MDQAVRQCIVPVLAGGGTRLPAHVGALQAIGELGYRYQHIVGVSGGGIIAALAAAGTDCETMKALFLDVDFSVFLGHSLVNLLLRGGLSSGAKFEHWMDEQLQGKRFADLETHLSIVATDVRSSQPVVFSRDTTPNLRVAQAVLYSISIPLLFPFHHYGEHILVDGSILSEDSLIRDWAGDRTPVVCFRLRDKRAPDPQAHRNMLPLADYLLMLIRTFMSTLAREFLSETLWVNTVLIECEDLSPLEFHMTPEQKNHLFELGYRTTLDILPLKLARGPIIVP
ncbi:MAG: patatin-like phospholipase family protein [Candidatus Contendobacter sp.]|nr:patatin-like phospholipase family protein [Candidatus Contendobacter sp.]